jgi:hypothetical protein
MDPNETLSKGQHPGPSQADIAKMKNVPLREGIGPLTPRNQMVPRTVFGDVTFSENEEEDPDVPTAAGLTRQQLVARQGWQ